MAKYKVVWPDEAKADLKNSYTYYKEKSLQGAKNVITDIRKAPKTIVFPKQSQIEPYNARYRRILVRNYKVLYRVDEEENILYVFGIIGMSQNPKEIKNIDNYFDR